MADPSKSANRKQRRAAARDGGKKDFLDQSDQKFELKQPDRSGPKAKTLYEIAEERRQELMGGQPFDTNPDNVDFGSSDFSDEPLGPAGEAIFYSVALSMLHFTLDVLIYQQYRQNIEWGNIWKRTFTVLPVLCLVIYILHTKTATRLGHARQVLFFVAAVAAGCNLIYSGNKHGYFRVMSRAPPLGTLWVWSTIEMQLPYAAASIAVIVAYFWAGGFSGF